MTKYVIVDIDGTLADCSHRRDYLKGDNGYPDWDKFFSEMDSDPCITPIRDLVNDLQRCGTKILLCSGRPERYRQLTSNWLAENGVYYSELHMRADGDYRSDVLVKKDMFRLFHLRNLDIDFVIDDRQSVVDMWREQGLICLQCAPGDFDKKEYEPGKLTLLIGPSGAGKNHFVANRFDYQGHVVSTDSLREEICSDFRDQSANEQVFDALKAIVKARIENGLDVVVNATNIRNRDRRALRDIVSPNTYITYIVIDRPLEEKLKDGGWRLDVNIKGKNLVEYHDNVFKSNLKDILNGDNDPRVTVINKMSYEVDYGKYN